MYIMLVSGIYCKCLLCNCMESNIKQVFLDTLYLGRNIYILTRLDQWATHHYNLILQEMIDRVNGVILVHPWHVIL